VDLYCTFLPLVAGLLALRLQSSSYPLHNKSSICKVIHDSPDDALFQDVGLLPCLLAVLCLYMLHSYVPVQQRVLIGNIPMFHTHQLYLFVYFGLTTD